ncbi:Sec-independent protein translocase protein TatB [Sphingomonas sp. R86520]|uniref:Sec-independent protein translocase protein TatB n=1 Tax=Sphingomonas sp. R86520 TaxID=3093859 RepID=UPI0036D3D7C3
MFDIAPSEFLLVAFVALVVIGPKDLPKAMRVVGYWVGKARGVARQFRSGFDSMVREAELEEMEKRWASENERIMREHPQTDGNPADSADADSAQVVHSPETDGYHEDHTAEPVMVEKPVVAAAEAPGAAGSTYHSDATGPVTEHEPAKLDVHTSVPLPEDKAGKSDVASS